MFYKKYTALKAMVNLFEVPIKDLKSLNNNKEKTAS
jgi:hypothetical protein